MRPWPAVLAKALGFHKPIVTRGYGPSRTSCHWHEQGGVLASSSRASLSSDSGRALLVDAPNRRPAVVGLVAPPYGLPSTDPTTRPSAFIRLRRIPVPSIASAPSAGVVGWHVPAAPTSLTTKCGWSAHADNRPRSGFPLDPLPSRGNRPPEGPEVLRADHLLGLTDLLSSCGITAAWRVS